MAGRRRSILAFCLLTSCLVPTFLAGASETVTYSYDARGRLVQVNRSGAVNDGVQANYTYDKADNRTSVMVVASGLPVLSVNDVAATEGSSLVFTVTRAGSTSLAISVNYSTSDATAMAGSDYTVTSGTLDFAVGEASKTIVVATTDDAAIEGAESINLTLSGATGGATISDAQGAGTINDNDVAPSFSIGSALATEGLPLEFTVTKSGTATGTLTVDYATASGTATSGTDFAATSGTLTFLDTDTTKTISVPTTDDATLESNETFTVTLSNASAGSTIASPQATGTISENDTPPPSFAINDVSVTEGGNLVLTVTKTGSTSSSFSVNFATANDTATAGSDYTAASGTLTFAAAETTKTITVATTDDAAVESAETVLVNLSGATGGAMITDAQGVGTINDNDNPPPSFAINDVSVTEGGNLVLTVTKTGSTSSSFSVNFATVNGTATAGSDYTAASGTLTFAAGDTTKTITIATTNDTAVESNETVMVNLSGATGGATISDSQGIGTINDNDSGTCAGVSFAVGDAEATEPETLIFTIYKNGSASVSCSVNYATANGTATAPSDYAANSGTATFNSGVTSIDVYVTTTQGTMEPVEHMYLNISSPTGGSTISDSQGDGTIYDSSSGLMAPESGEGDSAPAEGQPAPGEGQ